MVMDSVYLSVEKLDKTFLLHNQNNTRINVFKDVDLKAYRGECLVIHGESGYGKSTLLKTLYGNYLAKDGHIFIQHRGARVDLVRSEPRKIIQIRKETMGYVSQFLRVVPRVPCIDIVAEPLLERGIDQAVALEKAQTLLERLHIPSHLWNLSPVTFSGGEQQRVNLAHGFIADYPILLLDEPTASLDAMNRDVVIGLIHEKKAQGVALIGIFHDAHVRESVADRYVDMHSIGSLTP